MADRVYIPLGPLGTLDLPREVYERHLVPPLPPSSPSPQSSNGAAPALLDAEQLEERTGIPSSWWMAQARERRVPFTKIGRRVRFDYDAVMASEAVRKRAAV